jgi:hypothetical protein
MVRLPIAFLVTLVVFASAARADCPSSCLTSWLSPAVCTTDSSGTLNASGGECYSSATFDVPQGRLSLQGSANFTTCYCELDVPEDFRVEGLLAGTLVHLTARLDVKLTTKEGCCGTSSCSAQVVGPSGPGVSWQPGAMDTIAMVERDSTLFLPIDVTAGTTFRVTFKLSAGSSEAIGFGEALFSFEGIPEKASVVSCRGFVQSTVAVLTTSWGGIKARYR